jgi:tripartite-type tricarboxylate transporter receptor subunit TctC
MNKLAIVCLALGCLVPIAVRSSPAQAEDWPTRPITLTVPIAAGGATDTVARIIAQPFGEKLGQPVIVENVPGAGGMIGVARVARAAPDGYEIVIGGTDSFAQLQSLRIDPAYNALTDFSPIGLVANQPLLLIVRNGLGVSNMKEFVAYLHAHADKMQFGSAGVGSAPHLACSQLLNLIGVTVTHVPYRGSSAATQDLIAGNLDFYCPLATAAIPMLESKSAVAIAVLTKNRSPLFPDIPTAREQGYDVVDNNYWFALLAPKGVPEPIINKLNATLNTVLDDPDLQAKLRKLAAIVVPPDRRSPAYLQKYLGEEIKTWAAVIKASGITPN